MSASSSPSQATKGCGASSSNPPTIPATIALGASIACSGPCLTAVEITPHGAGCRFSVDAAAETLARTTLGAWGEGTRINLERSLKIGDELGGHLVTGHVDGISEIVSREEVTAEDSLLGREHPLHPARPGGDVSVHRGKRLGLPRRHLAHRQHGGDDLFSVLLIPHSLAVTTWGERRTGDRVNLEVDLIARYAARLSEAGGRSAPPPLGALV